MTVLVSVGEATTFVIISAVISGAVGLSDGGALEGEVIGDEDDGGVFPEIALNAKIPPPINSTTPIKATETISQEFVLRCSVLA
jgi:hypothetical protein